MINVFVKWNSKRGKSDIYINNDSWEVICWTWFSSKGKPIRMIGNAYSRNTFTICWARSGSNCCPRWFLDEYDVEALIDFKYGVDEKVILLNILREYLQVFQNHIVMPFIAEQVKFFWLSRILVYSFVCHSLLNWCFQKGQLYESAWCSPLQLRHLNEWGHSSPFFVSNLGGLIFLLALQHHAKWQ